MGKASESVNVAQSCADEETLQRSGFYRMGPAGFASWSDPGCRGGWLHTADFATGPAPGRAARPGWSLMGDHLCKASNPMSADLPQGRAVGGPLAYRVAQPEDAAACVTLRGQTRENAVSPERLRALGITEQTWAEDIRRGELPGHICSSGGRMVGYCYGSRSTGEIVVLALLPAFEGRGIGKELLGRMSRDLAALGHQRLFLGCSADPTSRSYGFYRHLGWRSTGELDGRGDEILESFPKP